MRGEAIGSISHMESGRSALRVALVLQKCYTQRELIFAHFVLVTQFDDDDDPMLPNY